MGAITSASTVYATAYLTEVGRKYLFQEGNNVRFVTLPDGTKIDKLKIERFSLGDPDVNYQLPYFLESGDIPDLSGENEKSLEIYKLIVKMIPYKEGFKKKILPNAYTKSKNKNISDICEAIINETTTYIKNKKCLIDIQSIRKFLLTIFKEAEDQAFKTFVSNLQNSKKDVDENIVSLVSNHFKRDIYFLNYKNRMPYMHCQTIKKLKKQKSIIIFCFGKGRYEVIGKLLNNNFIQREFDFDDIIIKKMYMFLVNPEKIQTNFKDLVQYLPQKGKKNSDSEEHSEENSEEHSEEDSEEDSEENSEEDSD